MWALTIIFLAVGICNAAEINSKKMFSDVYSLESNMLHGYLEVAANMGAINKNSWNSEVKTIIPHLTYVENGLQRLSQAISKFITAVQQQNVQAGPQNIYIPDEILNNIAINLKNIRINIDQNAAADLDKTLQQNKGSLESHNGIILLNTQLGGRFMNILYYIANQLRSSRDNTIQLQNAFQELSQAITDAKKSTYTPYLFKQLALTAQANANRLSDAAADIDGLIAAFKKAATFKLNGEYVIYGQQLIAATNGATKNIAYNYNCIVDNIEQFLEEITSSNST